MSQLTLSFKGKILKTFLIAEGEQVIGSDPSCEIHIDSLAVQARHATITSNGSEVVIRDLGSPDGTFVNNQKIEEHTLEAGDNIRIGKHTLDYVQIKSTNPTPEPKTSDETAAPAKNQPSAGWLQIMSGHNLGKTISLNRNITNLGTPGVQTAMVSKRTEGFFITHLEGANPPKVGNASIGDKAHQLNDGDIIQIGNVKMQFSLE
ncbi:MAG: FHA domain-containing protein [Gammaproteobacteria bacterium]|nr:FHA domain-containing protein [Gammaproteobacteria bacterium]